VAWACFLLAAQPPAADNHRTDFRPHKLPSRPTSSAFPREPNAFIHHPRDGFALDAYALDSHAFALNAYALSAYALDAYALDTYALDAYALDAYPLNAQYIAFGERGYKRPRCRPL
jgi:hypothetical protein